MHALRWSYYYTSINWQPEPVKDCICRFWIAEQVMKLKLLPGYVLQCRYIFPSIWTEYLQILDDTLVCFKNIVAGVCSMMHIQISAFIHVLKQGCFIIQVQSIWIEKFFTHGNMNKKKKKSMSGSSYLRSIRSFGLWFALIYTTSGQGEKRWMDSSTMQICFWILFFHVLTQVSLAFLVKFKSYFRECSVAHRNLQQDYNTMYVLYHVV